MTHEVSQSHMKQLAEIQGWSTQEIDAVGHNLDNCLSKRQKKWKCPARGSTYSTWRWPTHWASMCFGNKEINMQQNYPKSKSGLNNFIRKNLFWSKRKMNIQWEFMQNMRRHCLIKTDLKLVTLHCNIAKTKWAPIKSIDGNVLLPVQPSWEFSEGNTTLSWNQTVTPSFMHPKMTHLHERWN